MEPVEINAGTWYLRALRVDDRVDDRPALADLGEIRPDYVELRAAQWGSATSGSGKSGSGDSGSGALCSWAVCEPSTGEMVAEVTLEPSTGVIDTRARPGQEPAAQAGAGAVRRFADAVFER